MIDRKLYSGDWMAFRCATHSSLMFMQGHKDIYEKHHVMSFVIQEHRFDKIIYSPKDHLEEKILIVVDKICNSMNCSSMIPLGYCSIKLNEGAVK